MRSKLVLSTALLLVLALAGAQAASAKEQFAYSVKFVCGYNPTNLGVSGGFSQGEPPVKFGNYATEINILWPELYVPGPAYVFKHLVILVDRGRPAGREPNAIDAKKYIDSIKLDSLQGTMDDCNRIGELIYGVGNVPTPMPLFIGYLVLTSTHELDVTAVYTSQACSNWIASPEKLDCLDSTGRQQGVSSSIDVEAIPGRRLLLE